MKQKRQRRVHFDVLKTISFWSSIGLSLLAAVVYLLSRPEIAAFHAPEFLELVEAKTLDLRFLLRGARKPPPEIVIVAVDEKTEDELGRWQSAGRQWLAQFLDILNVIIRDGYDSGAGGGIFNNDGSLTIGTGCTITHNTAGGDGGGICNIEGTLIVEGTISDNRAAFLCNAGEACG